MSTPLRRTPPRRVRRQERVAALTPPRENLDDVPGTPPPIKARINNLSGQVQELVRKNQALERKLAASASTYEHTLEERDAQVAEAKLGLETEARRVKRLQTDLERCKAEGDGMRKELNLHSMVQQQKALLALAEEKMQMVELEQRLVHADVQRVQRDHKLVLFQSREADLVAEVDDKAARIDALEEALAAANTSLVHQRAAQDKADVLASSATETRAEVTALEGKLAKLEKSHATLEQRNCALEEAEAATRAELEHVESEAAKGSADAEQVAELKKQLRETERNKAEQAELVETYKAKAERLKTKFQAKLQESQDEVERLREVEEELEVLKAAEAVTKAKPRPKPKAPKKAVQDDEPEPAVDESPDLAAEDGDDSAEEEQPKPRKKAAAKTKPKAKPKPAAKDADEEAPEPEPPKRRKAPSRAASRSVSPEKPKTKKERTRKTSPVESDVEDEAPQKKKRAAKKPLVEADTNKSMSEEKADEPDDDESAPPPPVLKKKRKLLGTVAAFAWDPVLNSGDGVIPTSLSPAKPRGAAGGTIPRAGFGALSSRSRARF